MDYPQFTLPNFLVVSELKQNIVKFINILNSFNLYWVNASQENKGIAIRIDPCNPKQY